MIVPPVNPDGTYTRPDPGEPFGPAAQEWIYTYEPVTEFYSLVMSGVTRLPNGNTLICSTVGGWFFEVNSKKEVVWQYVNPVVEDEPQRQGSPPGANKVFRCSRYPADFPGFDGRNLIPSDPLEIP